MVEKIVVDEGFWFDIENPSIGGVGIPKETLENRAEEERMEKIYSEIQLERDSAVFQNAYEKAMGITSEKGKIELLKRLGYSHVNTRGGKLNLDGPFLLDDKNKKFLYSMYERILKGLDELRKNPSKTTDLSKRVLSAFR